LRDATTDEAMVRRWWSRRPNANIGVLTGATSGFIALDVDPRHGGAVALEALEGAHARLPATVESLTGGGGRHVFLKHPGAGVKVKSVAGALGPGLDLKGDGGYVVAPPSLHVSGQQYQWKFSSDPADLPLADMPQWLLALLAEKPAQTELEASQVEGPIGEGQRNDALTRVAGSMRRAGLAEGAMVAALLEENRRLCNPPLPEDEVRGIARSVARYGASWRGPPPKSPQSIRT
jgi:putative DNA primase/helicase